MKKLFNSRFLFIIASSLVVLIALGIGAFYLFDDSDDMFVKSGYVLNPLSSNVEKYFFDEDATYKENLSSMVEFRDVDDKDVSVLRDSFLHYLDESLSFLKNGAILDLDSINGGGAVKFYNITNDSIIERDNDKYVIKTSGGDIELDNFIGRISDNKYIVVGNLSAKLSGNSSRIEAEYFEIVYVEEGVVNIENKDIKYQVAAEETSIYVGNNLVIDLGNKKIVSNDEDVMSITAITIDGDENIEIIPKAEEEKDNSGGGGTGSGSGTGTGSGNGNGNGNGTGSGEGTGTGSGTGSGDGTGTGDAGNGTEGDGTGNDTEKDENTENDGTGEGTGNGTGSGSGTGDGSTGGSSGNGTGGGVGDGTGTGGGTGGNGTGGTGDGNIDIDRGDELTVSLKDAVVGSTNVDVTFEVYNQEEDDVLMLKVTNLDTGRTVDLVAEVVTDQEIKVNLLSPNTKYLFTVINEKDNGKYFQKIFKTVDFGIKLERSYATDSELAYKISVAEGTDITNAKLTLYKYNEETKQNEVVTTSYYDSETDTTKYVEKIAYISDLEDNVDGVREVVYDGLDSNTIYTAVLDEFSVASSNFKDIYNITLTSMTLKKAPRLTEMIADKVVGKETGFKLSLGNIVDEDNAIVSYTYLVYENSNPNTAVIDPIVKTNASPIEVKIGDDKNQLRNDTNYFYKVIIEYFDNEKYIEYVHSDTVNFVMGSDPLITVEPVAVSYDSIKATIYLTDNSCLVSIPDREKCAGTSTTVVDVTRINALTGEPTSIFTKLVDFTVTENEIKYDLVLDKLQAGTTYSVSVRAVRNDSDSNVPVTIEHSDDSQKNITTKSLSSFINDWSDKGSTANHVVNIQSKFIADEGTGTLSPDESAASIQKVVVKLYEGDNIENLQTQTPIAMKSFYNNDTFNIKESFYDKGYVITTDETFGLDIDELREIGTDGKLSQYYTLAIYAYYDVDERNQVRLSNNIVAYEISPILLMDNIVDPVLQIKEITNKESGIENNLLNTGTHVGYSIEAKYDINGLIANNLDPESVNLYVYNVNGQRVKFYIMNDKGDLKLVDKLTDPADDSGYYSAKIYMGNATEYHVEDSEIMARGNEYYIGYDIKVNSTDGSGNSFMYPTIKNNSNEESSEGESTKGSYPFDVDSGIYKSVIAQKETPQLKMYIAKSTADSITYRYQITDPDNSLYRENSDASYGFYYTAGDGTEKKLEITPKEGNIKSFAGDVTIEGLSNGMVYSLYYKRNVTKTGVFEDDVAYDDNSRIFDGYYDVINDDYNFKYQVINDQANDNKVVIKILANDKMLDRILAYKVHFEDSKGNTLDKEIWQLGVCDGASTGEGARCFSVDYVELKNKGMKSEGASINSIKVAIDAIYDTGLTGYDFTVGEDGQYKYMIMQNNNTAEEFGSYISFSSGGKVVVWGGNINAPKGFYTYTFDGKQIHYVGEHENYKKGANINVNLTAQGYDASDYGILNPKMVAQETMQGINNTFSFNSITPKVKVSQGIDVIQLVNGAVVNLTLSGADLNDFVNEGTEQNPKYYLYVDVWNNREYALDDENYQFAKTRPTLKVEIDADVPAKTVEAVIDGLLADGRYYFNVYAYMYKIVDGQSQKKLTQLFDANEANSYTVKTYEFKALNPSTDLFHNINVDYKVNDEGNYGNRDLEVNIGLYPYKNLYPYNFDIVYAFCYSDDSTCGIGENNTNIFKKTISKENVTDSIVDTEDITKYDLEYGKNVGYYIYVYAIYDFYGNTAKEENKTEREVLLNGFNVGVTLDKLTEPTFVIGRSASNDGDNYYIDFNINVNDPDRTFVNGNYYVKLLDENKEIVGTLQELDEDGNYQPVNNYQDVQFDASVLNKNIRITNLSSDTKYTIVVYGDAYLNNYSETVPKDERTKEIIKEHTVYSVNNYGVAFGRDLLFSATEKSIVVTFLGGSSFDNVTEVGYTIGLWDNEQTSSTTNGTYELGDGSKGFEIFEETKDWRFVIDPDGMKNVLGQTYTVALSFKVKIPGTDPEEYVVLTSADNPSFAGRVQYVEDKK